MYVQLDENNRIVGACEYNCFSNDTTVIDIDLPSNIDLGDIHNYKVIDGKLVYSKRPDEIESEINELKLKLSQTDYVVMKIAEGVSDKEEYHSVLESRKRWRNKINELRKELD